MASQKVSYHANKSGYVTCTIDTVLTLQDFADAQREKDEQGKKMVDRYNEKLAEFIRKAPKVDGADDAKVQQNKKGK